MLDFLRNEIAVKESEVKDDDIIKVFPAADPDLQRVYVQFSTKEQAELCLELTRKLRKPDLNVVLYIPREFKDRFHAMKREDYRLRKLTEPSTRLGLDTPNLTSPSTSVLLVTIGMSTTQSLICLLSTLPLSAPLPRAEKLRIFFSRWCGQEECQS